MTDRYAELPPIQGAGSVRGYAERAGRWGGRFLPGGQRTFWVAVGLILVALLVWAVRPSPNAQTGAGVLGTGGPTPVGVAVVRAGDLAVTLNALGTVTPLATVTVKPQTSGILEKIDFQEGQTVHKGDLLAEIDPRPFQAALDQAKGQLARDDAQLANAKIDLGRYQALSAQQAISDQIRATQAALVRTDAGTVKADQAAVEAAVVNLQYCRITSPVAGRVGLRQVDVGNLVQAGVTTAIVVVTQLQPMSIVFALPEDDLTDVMRGVNAGDRLSVDAFDRSQSTKLASGSLSTVDNVIDPTTGTVKMRAIFDNSGNTLFPSQFVNVRLLVDTLHNQSIVPSAAIQRGASGTFVFAVNANRTVSMRTVTLGPTDGDKVAIVNGLSPGETVVVDGADRLRDGAIVSIPGGKPTAAGVSGASVGGQHHGRHHHRPAGAQGSGQ
jgi:multidrug efflux system membrane fusion protein